MFDSISDLLLAHDYNINAEAQAFQKTENWVNYNIPFRDIQNHTVESFAKLAISKGLLPENCLAPKLKVEVQTDAMLFDTHPGLCRYSFMRVSAGVGGENSRLPRTK